MTIQVTTIDDEQPQSDRLTLDDTADLGVPLIPASMLKQAGAKRTFLQSLHTRALELAVLVMAARREAKAAREEREQLADQVNRLLADRTAMATGYRDAVHAVKEENRQLRAMIHLLTREE